MTATSPTAFEAKVARYAIARLRLGQVLLPFAIVTSVVARRAPTVASAVVALVVIGGGLVLFLSAVRRYGWQSLRLERGGLFIADAGYDSNRFRQAIRDKKKRAVIGSKPERPRKLPKSRALYSKRYLVE